ncbi:MAG: GNAT family N-acetyltransferase [Bacteroidetes bacterium]|nr:GNAT family N-acetyltransferase [Bacteroidota bacterium]
MITLRNAATAEDIATIRELFTEYQSWLQFSLCFQGFDKELAELPGKYAPPAGRLLLAEADGVICGCIALRPFDGEGVCEMKRLFVREAFRGRGIGRMMTEQIVAEARAIGYHTMRLDTLQRMEEARALYRQLGFTETPAYYDNPLDGVVYLELQL